MSSRKESRTQKLVRFWKKSRTFLLSVLILAAVGTGLFLVTKLPMFSRVQHTLCVLLDREVDAYNVYLGDRCIGAVEETDLAKSAWNTAVLRLNAGDVAYKIDPMYTVERSRIRYSKLASENMLAASFGLYLEDVVVDFSEAGVALYIGQTLVVLKGLDDVYELFTRLAQRELGDEAIALCTGIENGIPVYSLTAYPSRLRSNAQGDLTDPEAPEAKQEGVTLENICFPEQIGYQILYVRDGDCISVDEAVEQCTGVEVYRVYREIYQKEEDPPVEYVSNSGMYTNQERVLNSGSPALLLAEDMVYYCGSEERQRDSVSAEVLREAKTRYIERGTMPVPDFYWPATGVITSYFGYREQFGAFHEGIDIANRQGTYIRAAADGIVVKASYNDDGLGNYIIINHQNHYRTWYGHNYALLVKEGDYVHQGQIIALMGSTGFSTGPHCHFEIEYNGHVVDPYPYLSQYGSRP